MAELLDSSIHEHRFVALVVLVERHRRGTREERPALTRFYLERRAGVDHWDLVDVSAPTLLGEHLVDHDREVLGTLAGSQRLWDRRTRIALMATWPLIRRREFGPTFELAERLLDHPSHLVHKAGGWMLREIGKRDEAALVAWLSAHAPRMPRVMLRYATERLARDRAELMA